VLRRVLATLFLVASVARGQDQPSVQITPQADANGTPGISLVVQSRGVLASGQLRSLVSNGFPARMHYKVEEWAVGRLFDDLKRTTEWDVVVRFDALAKTYEAFRVNGNVVTRLGTFADFDGAANAVEDSYVSPAPPPRKNQRSYYSLSLEVESLSVSDLDEVERWLRGELKPAIRGKKNPGTALSRGLGTLFVRLMGGDKRRYEARTPRFTPQ
jgi:hypothetical protein